MSLKKACLIVKATNSRVGSLRLSTLVGWLLLHNKTIVDLCFGSHGVLLNSKLNHIDLRSASVNMTFTVQ